MNYWWILINLFQSYLQFNSFCLEIIYLIANMEIANYKCNFVILIGSKIKKDP